MSSGKGALHPKMAPVINEFRDVLVQQIPGGLPPERSDEHGDPIDHTIEVPSDAVPFKRNPKPFTAEEDVEIRRYLQDFIAKG